MDRSIVQKMRRPDIMTKVAKQDEQKKIRVLLIEDHFLARIALISVLARVPQLEIVGEAADGEEGLRFFESLQPDVVLLDLRLPVLSGFEVIKRLKSQSRDAKIVVLSNYQGSEDIYHALYAGALCYLTKGASGEELIEAITAAYEEKRYLPRDVLDRLAELTHTINLTPRETQVLVCITKGRSNREIAEELNISEKTVRIHVSALLEKMQLRDRTQAAILALQRGLVHLD